MRIIRRSIKGFSVFLIIVAITVAFMPMIPDDVQQVYAYDKDSYKIIWPTKKKTITASWGIEPFHTSIGHAHYGIDIGAKSGDPVSAIADGIVYDVGYSAGGYGKYVVIKHKYKDKKKGTYFNLKTPWKYSLYAHCKSISVKKGAYVKQGRVIAHVGNTGASYGAHLHLGLYKKKNGWKKDFSYSYTTLTCKPTKYLGKTFTAKCTHNWSAKTGACTNDSCNLSYWDVSDYLNTTSKTTIGTVVYKLSAKADVKFWPGGNKNKTTLAKGTYVYVFGKDKNYSNYYKIRYGGNSTGPIGYVLTSKVTPYTSSTSPSKVTVSVSSFNMQPKAKRNPSGTITSKNPIKSVNITVLKNDKTIISGKSSYSDTMQTSINLNDSNQQFNKDLNFFQSLDEGSYTIKVTATDVLGSSDTKTAIITVGGISPPEISNIKAVGESKTVTITTEEEGGTTYYSINDGEEKKIKGASVTVSAVDEGENIVKAYTVVNNRNNSEVRSCTQTKEVFLERLNQPEIDIEQQGDKGKLTIEKTEEKSTILFKTDDGNYQEYKEPVMVDDGETVYAYEEQNGMLNSEVNSVEADFTVPDQPEISLANDDPVIAAGKTATVNWIEDKKAETYIATLYKKDNTGEFIEVNTIETVEPSATFILNEAGEFHIDVVASNGIGNSDASNQIDLVAKDALNVVFRDSGVVDENTGEEDGAIISSLKVGYGDVPERVEEPSKKGNTFIGWESSSTGNVSTNEYLQTTVKSDTTYTARYKKNKYKVRFYDPNGEYLTSETVEFEEDAVTDDVLEKLQEKGFITTGKTVSGWSVISVADTESKADVHSVDAAMDVQAIITWEKEDLPVIIQIDSVQTVLDSKEGVVFKPKVTVTTNETEDLDIYLVASLKGYDTNRGVEKTLYSDRRAFSLQHESGFTLNQTEGLHDFDLQVKDPTAASAVKSLEIIALERTSDDRTGSTYSEVAVYDNIERDFGLTEPTEWSTDVPEEKEGRIIETKTQYSYRDKIFAYSGKDTLDGYPNKVGTETVSTTYSAWSPTSEGRCNASDNKLDAYRDTTTVENKTVYKSFAKFCNCGKWTWKSKNGVCEYCGGKTLTANKLCVYSSKKLKDTGYKVKTTSGSGKDGYILPKTIALGTQTPKAMGEIYCLRQNAVLQSFTTKQANLYLWQEDPETISISRTKTVRTRNQFYKWSEWSEWSDTQYTGSSTKEVKPQTLYRYSDVISAPELLTDLEGNVINIPEDKPGKLDVEEDLSGKVATVMVYQTINNDPNKFQMQYTGQIVIGTDNEYSISFIPKDEPTITSGNYIVALSIEGYTGLITIGVVEAPKERHNVTINYIDEGNETVLSTQVIEDGDDVDMSAFDVPEREGYYFAGWSRNTTNITENCTISAVYLPIRNNIVFVDWVNQTIQMQKADTGEIISAPQVEDDADADADAAYQFKGWKKEDGSLINDEFAVTGDMIITAYYEQTSHTVSFHREDGTILDTQIVNHGQSASPPNYSVPNSVGEFVCWSTQYDWMNVKEDIDVYPIVDRKETAPAPEAVVTQDEEANEQTLELVSEEGTRVFYTLDGTVPTADLIEDYLRHNGTGEDSDQYTGSIQEYTEPLTFDGDTDLGVNAATYVEGENESELISTFIDSGDVNNEDDGITLGSWEEIGYYSVSVEPGKDINMNVDLNNNPGLTSADIRIVGDDGLFNVDTEEELGTPMAVKGEALCDSEFSTGQDEGGWKLSWRSDEVDNSTGNLCSMTLHVGDDVEPGIYQLSACYAKENTLDENHDEVALDDVSISFDEDAVPDISTMDVNLDNDVFSFTGSEIKPTVTVSGLEEGVDYKVTYSNNVNAGTAIATITGIGSYKGSVDKEYTISKANISDTSIAEIPAYDETGEPIQPELSISLGDYSLMVDRDYSLSYENNTEIGTAKVTITGIGNFEGATEKTFEIVDSGGHIDKNMDGICDKCGDDISVTITVTSSGGGDTVSPAIVAGSTLGNNKFTLGQTATISIQAVEGYNFNGWYANDNKVSQSLKYSFKITQDIATDYVAKFTPAGKIKLTVDGTPGKYSINSKTQVGSKVSKSYAAGTIITLDTTDENFKYWVNENGRIVSRTPEYSFKLTSDSSISIITGVHIEHCAVIEFVSDYDQMVATESYSTEDETPESFEVSYPPGPSKTGYTFVGWSVDGENVITNSALYSLIENGIDAIITLKPLYEQKDETYSINVYVDGVYNAGLSKNGLHGGDTYTINAPNVEGKRFQYWADGTGEGATILSYSSSYFGQVSCSYDLYAVYGTEAIEVVPTVAMIEASADEEDNQKRLAFKMGYNVPAGYTIVETGEIWSKNALSEDEMVLNAPGVNKFISSLTTNSGVVTMRLNVNNNSTDITVYARGYLTVTNTTTGNTETIYSDSILSGSYNSLIE